MGAERNAAKEMNLTGPLLQEEQSESYHLLWSARTVGNVHFTSLMHDLLANFATNCGLHDTWKLKTIREMQDNHENEASRQECCEECKVTLTN